MTDEYKCSFCGRSRDEVDRLAITGEGGVAICKDCAEIALEAMIQERS